MGNCYVTGIYKYVREGMEASNCVGAGVGSGVCEEVWMKKKVCVRKQDSRVWGDKCG